MLITMCSELLFNVANQTHLTENTKNGNNNRNNNKSVYLHCVK